MFDALRPPDGYDLDVAIGTSYTLDLLTPLTAPLPCQLCAHEETTAPLTADPLALLESLRRYADRILLFCQAGHIKTPPRNQPLLAHLERCVVEVQPPSTTGVFHPK